MEDLVEVIKEGEIIKMSEWQAKEEDLFILRKVIDPVSRVIDRKPVRSSDSNIPNLSLADWKLRRFGYKKNNVVKDLKDNFHWDVIRARRTRGINRKQLADAVEASENEIKIIELGDLPRDDFVLISKIERIFGINLRKNKQKDEMTLLDLQKMSEDRVRETLDKYHKKEFGKKQKENKKQENISGDDIEILGE